MAFTLFNSLSTRILAPIQASADIAGTLATWTTPFFLVGITIYLISYGFDVMRGAGGTQYILDALAKVARPFLVLNIALAAGMYSSVVVAFFTELRTDLSGAFGARGVNSYAAIDASIDNVLFTVYTMFPIADKNISFVPADVSGIIMYLCLAVIALAMIFYGVVACLNLILIDASLAIIFGLGPLFIACFAWQSTSRFFDSWLSTVLKYVLTAVFIAMIIGMANGLVMRLASGIKADSDALDFITLALSTLATACVLVMLIGRVAGIAADLVGGIAISLAGPAAVAGVSMGAASGVAPALQTAGRTTGYAAGTAVGAAGRAASGSSLGVRVLQATQGMRERASSAAAGINSFGNAVSGRSVEPSGRVSTGHGMANAFRLGRNATSNTSGTGTISGSSGSRPVPNSNWRD